MIRKITLSVCLLSLVLVNTTFGKGIQAKYSKKHVGIGIGYVTSHIPLADAELKILLTQLNYDYSFMDPHKNFRTSVETGIIGFWGILPIPQVGANLYIGSEDKDIQAKVGINGFYDISVGGHAGFMIKTGVVIKNRFDVSLFTVPAGSDANSSYAEFLGMESKEEAEANYEKNKAHVIMPYYGLMFTVRL